MLLPEVKIVVWWFWWFCTQWNLKIGMFYFKWSNSIPSNAFFEGFVSFWQFTPLYPFLIWKHGHSYSCFIKLEDSRVLKKMLMITEFISLLLCTMKQTKKDNVLWPRSLSYSFFNEGINRYPKTRKRSGLLPNKQRFESWTAQIQTE